jgi:hypothetical protein
MIKRPRFSKGELLLVAEAVRFYRAFIEESQELLKKDELELKSLKYMFHLTNDKNVWDEIKERTPWVERARKLRYTKRSCCLAALERRLSALPEGHKYHSTIDTAMMNIDELEPVTEDEIVYWVEAKTVEKRSTPLTPTSIQSIKVYEHVHPE